MSRQPRKVFGFTGGAKYGPVAEGEEGDSAPKAAGAPKAADMNRNSTGSGDKEESSLWEDCTDCFKDCLGLENRRGV